MAARNSRQTSQAHTNLVELLWIAIWLGLLLSISDQHADAQSKKCSQRTVDRLEAESETIRDWSKLLSFYYRYRKCHIDDAEVSTGVSESVARLLVDHWQTLKNASKLFEQDRAFETFALAGINITDSTDDLSRIDKLALEQCPPDLHVLCQKIRDSIKDNN